MRVFLNPGHDPEYDSGAVNQGMGLRECDVARDVGVLVAAYLEKAGCEVRMLQSDNLNGESNYADRQNATVCGASNDWPADIFVSLHCNAANAIARGTEICVYRIGGEAEKLAGCILHQIVNAVGTKNRGLKERPGLCVLRRTDMPAVLVEMAFIDNDSDARILRDRQDDLARAIARGITDYEMEE